MLVCKPEGWGGAEIPVDLAGWREAIRDERVMEAVAAHCDTFHNLHVNLGDYRGVIPRTEAASGIDTGKTKEIAILSRVGKPVCFRAVGFAPAGADAPGGPRILLSRRLAQGGALALYRRHAPPGTVIDARVTHLENFGVFVDIGWGFGSFIGIENISVSRISHPAERLRTGWDIKAVVTGTEEAAPGAPGRVLLSHKELLGTWAENAALFSPGETVPGIVRSVEDYGVFVELRPNLSGLCEKNDRLREGERIIVYIKSIQPDRMKIKLNFIDTLPTGSPPARPRYFLPENGRLTHWRFAPENCTGKGRETVFIDGAEPSSG